MNKAMVLYQHGAYLCLHPHNRAIDKFHYITHDNLDRISVSFETTQPAVTSRSPQQLTQLLQVGNLHQQGKMILLIYFTISFNLMCSTLATNIMPELKKNVLNFRYRANFKYEGMLTHSFDRFYVVTKFEMPKIDDLKLTTFTFDFACKHLMSDRTFMQKYLKHCQRIVPYVRLYQKQVQYYAMASFLMCHCEFSTEIVQTV